MNWGSFLFGFDGRINRAKIWLFVLIAIIAYIVFWLILTFAFGASLITFVTTLAMRPLALFAGTMPLPLILFLLFYVVLFYVGLAVSAKRLHDRDKGAIWLVIFIILPQVLNIAGAIIAPVDLAAAVPSANPIKMILNLVSFILSIWGFVELYCLRGTVGENRYGPDPLPPPTA